MNGMRGFAKRSALVAGLAFALSLGRVAAAQTDEQRAAARELGQQGVAAFEQARYAEAIDRLSKAESLVHAPTFLLYLARSHAKLGQFVRAREAYLKIMNETLAPSAPQPFRDAQKSASQEITAVEPSIGRITVNFAGSPPPRDVVILVDGTTLASVLIGAPQPIDPGEHSVEASAPGLRALPVKVAVEKGQSVEVTLSLVADPTSAPGAAPAPAAPQGPNPANPTDSGGSNGMRIGAYVSFGVGALGLAAGTVFLLQSTAARGRANDICDQNGGQCPPGSRNEIERHDADANSAGTLSIVGFGIGAAGIGTGVALLLLSKEPEQSSASISPWIGPKSVGVSGRF